jgi:polyhydroxybutyrate depolymerase
MCPNMLQVSSRIIFSIVTMIVSMNSWTQINEFVRGPERVYLPTDYSDSNSYPLVILLHAYGMDTAQAESIWGLAESVDNYQFVYAIPSGTLDQSGSYFWNSKAACCNFYNSAVDDVSYLYQYIQGLEKSFNINANRIYVVGDSNGGFMALELAYRFPDLVAASVSSAGGSHFYPRNHPRSGVHILQIQGTEDTSILYAGGSIEGLPYLGSEATALQWAEYNKCSSSNLVAGSRDLDPFLSGFETEVTIYSQGCRIGGSVELWAIQKGGHGLGRPVPRSSKLQLLDWLYKKSKDGWPSDFNGVIPPKELGLSLNNVGFYDALEGLVYSCLRLTNNGEPYSFEGVSDFDVAFTITDALNGKIKLLKYRAFNSGEVLNKDFELPNCSGELEISTGTYSDTLQVDATFYEFDFKLLDSSSDELVLVSSREIPLR